MNKKKNVPDGYEIIGEGQFFKFEEIGDAFQGIFLGIKEMKSKFSRNNETYIVARSSVDNNIYLVPVKTAVRDRLAELKEDEMFFLRYDGDRKSSNGRVYKEFTLAVSRIPL